MDPHSLSKGGKEQYLTSGKEIPLCVKMARDRGKTSRIGVVFPIENATIDLYWRPPESSGKSCRPRGNGFIATRVSICPALKLARCQRPNSAVTTSPASAVKKGMPSI